MSKERNMYAKKKEGCCCDRFKKALIERALGAEMSHHLGYRPGAAKPEQATNHRNGNSGKTVLTDGRPAAHRVPRDRDGSSSRCSSASTSGASPASTTRSWPCTRAA
jgi:putative transposase